MCERDDDVHDRMGMSVKGMNRLFSFFSSLSSFFLSFWGGGGGGRWAGKIAWDSLLGDGRHGEEWRSGVKGGFSAVKWLPGF